MTVTDLGDLAAASGAAGSWVGFLPEVAAAMAIIWTAI